METCKVEGCDRSIEVKLSRQCRKHYLRDYRKGRHVKEVRWAGSDVCESPECEREVSTMGLCSKHYQASRAPEPKGFRETKWVNSDGTRKLCGQDGCTAPVKVSGLCSPHYHAQLKIGTNREKKPDTFCPVPGCGKKKAFSGSICGGCNQRRWRYGIELDRYLEMMRPENRVCSNSGCFNDSSNARMHLDHDHSCCPPGTFEARDRLSCGECIRGWLCYSCNVTLGLMKEDPQRIEGLLLYLESTKRVRQ